MASRRSQDPSRTPRDSPSSTSRISRLLEELNQELKETPDSDFDSKKASLAFIKRAFGSSDEESDKSDSSDNSDSEASSPRPTPVKSTSTPHTAERVSDLSDDPSTPHSSPPSTPPSAKPMRSGGRTTPRRSPGTNDERKMERSPIDRFLYAIEGSPVKTTPSTRGTEAECTPGRMDRLMNSVSTTGNNRCTETPSTTNTSMSISTAAKSTGCWTGNSPSSSPRSRATPIRTKTPLTGKIQGGSTLSGSRERSCGRSGAESGEESDDSDKSDDSGFTTYSPTRRLAWADISAENTKPDDDHANAQPPPVPRAVAGEAPVPVSAYGGSAPSKEWVQDLMVQMERASHQPARQLPQTLSYSVAQTILEDAIMLLKSKRSYGRGGTVVDINVEPRGSGADPSVNVVGDTHGQFHDFLTLLSLSGSPSNTNLFVFNGDFVDRGLWGLEILLSVISWKLALPDSITVLRGNHESEYCTRTYGFHSEICAKYGNIQGNRLFSKCLQVFSLLPLAAVVNHSTLIVHGGLWRKPVAFQHRKRRKKGPDSQPENELQLGTLEELRNAMSGGKDPDGMGNSQVAADVLWSDPIPEKGLHENVERGIGLIFGPDVTEAFLAANKLSLVIRSHEGPDAREKRDGMSPMSRGFTEDHKTPQGKLVTVFSAPCYPMFVPEDEDQPTNDAAFLTLKAPNYTTPIPTHFCAVPRPEGGTPYYSLYDEDEEEEGEGEEDAGAGK